MKKLILLIAVVMAAFAFISCADEKEVIKGEDSAFAGIDPDELDDFKNDPNTNDLGEYDFKNYTFRILTRKDLSMNPVDAEEAGQEPLSDAIYTRNRNIEERYNFKFKEIEVDNYHTMDEGKTSILAGTNDYDIMLVRGEQAYIMATEGLLRPITALPQVNLSKPYWNPDLTAQFSVVNKSYFAAPAFDMYMYGATAMPFNKQMAANLGLPNLYDIVREGKWTFDKFNEFGKRALSDVNGDGKRDEYDQYGIVGVRRGLIAAFWIGGGVTTVSFDSDDIPYLSAKEEPFLNVWFRMWDILVDQGVWFYDTPDNNEPGTQFENMFRNGQSLFYTGGVGSAQTFRDMDIEFGIIPYPKYDENQENYYGSVVWIEPVSIPMTASDEDLDRTSVILEALACEAYRLVIPVYMETILKRKFTRDAESEEMIDIIWENRVFDWGDCIWVHRLRDGLFSELFINKANKVVSTLNSTDRVLKREIEDLVKAFEDAD